MILIVDHRSRFPEALLDIFGLRDVNQIYFVRSKFIVILSVFGARMWVFS